MRIILSSKSDKKIKAVKDALKYLKINDYELITHKVESDVSDNPLNDETLQGARNRNNNLKKIAKDYDMLISIEAGFTKENSNYFLDTYCVIEYKNKKYIGKSPRLKITSKVYEYVKNGNVLHLLVQELQGTETNDGVIGYLTNGKLKRTQIEEISVIDALINALNLSKENIIIDTDKFIDKLNIIKLDSVIDEKL